MAINFHPLPVELFPRAAQPYIHRFNGELRDLFGLESVIRSPLSSKRSDRSISRGENLQVHLTRIAPDVTTFKGVKFFQQDGTPTAPAGLSFWLKTTTPSELYVSMKITGGSWDWVPIVFAP